MLAEKEEGKPDRLEEKHFWAYGVGHFVNDLTIACWLNFLVFYLDRVVKTPAAPYVFLVGQIADGVATPIVAILSDRTNSRLGTPLCTQANASPGTLWDLSSLAPASSPSMSTSTAPKLSSLSTTSPLAPSTASGGRRSK